MVMKQLIALGNGGLCLAAQGSILEACPTDAVLCKHIRVVSHFPGRSAFPAPSLVCSLQTRFISLFHQPSMLNVVCANSQHERSLCQHRRLLGDAQAPELPVQHRAWVAPYPWEWVVVLPSQCVITTVCDSYHGS